MPRDATTLAYATPVPDATNPRITGASVVRFVAGFGSYALIALVISRLDSLAGAKLLGRVGLGGFHEAILWAMGLGFLWFVIHAQRKWRWTGFTLGVVTGIGLTLTGFAIFYVVWMRGMAAF